PRTRQQPLPTATRLRAPARGRADRAPPAPGGGRRAADRKPRQALGARDDPGADAAPPRSGTGVPVGRERPDQERTHAPIRHPDGNGVTMNPRAKSSEAEAGPSEETQARRRGRTRKEQAPAEETAAEAATTAPKRRGRPPKDRPAEAAAGDDGAPAAAEAPAAMTAEDERAEEAPAEVGEDRGARTQERQEERQPEP